MHVPVRMLEKRHQQLDRSCCCGRRQTWSGHRTHLIQRPVCKRLLCRTCQPPHDTSPKKSYISGCDNVVAVVATQPLAFGEGAPYAVAHHQKAIEAEGRIHNNLCIIYALNGGRAADRPGQTLPFDAPITVGSHRLSRESISRKTTSCSSKSFSRVATSCFVCSTELGGIGCPGIGMLRL